MDRTADRIRAKKKHTAGETLVETLVAFAVLMVLLTLVTTAVKTAASLNSHAILQVNGLEEAGLAAETGGGTDVPGAGKLTMTFSAKSELRFVGENGQRVERAELPVQVKQAGENPTLFFFTQGVTADEQG